MRQHAQLCLLAAASVIGGCASAVHSHMTLTSAGAAHGTAGFGLGMTSSMASSVGRSEAFEDVRTEHAADTTDTAERRWQTVFAPTDTPDAALLFQRLELCEHTTSGAYACKPATQTLDDGTDAPLEALWPTIVESGNLGVSARRESVSASWGGETWTRQTQGGSVSETESRAATSAFGIWVLSMPVGSIAGLFGGSINRTGQLYFCHAAAQGPRCRLAPGPGIARILSTHVLRSVEGPKHVIWFQAAEVPEGYLTSHPADKLVRCEVKDEALDVACSEIEVKE